MVTRISIAPSSDALAPSLEGLDRFAVGLPSFARSFTQRGARMAWLLGAGASVMSGLPTAGDLIRQFHHSVYCTENGLAVEQVDERDPRVQQRILGWFATRPDLPQPGDLDEYSAMFELAYGDPGDRAEFIRRLVADARPNYGHYVMAALMAADLLRVVFTTNFDDLPEQAARSLLDSLLVSPRRPLVAADLGDPGAAARALSRESWPLVAKLHGDFLSDTLKNTAAELRAQDELMRQALLDTCRRFGLVVAGYSGRDSSIMQVLFEALGTPGAFPGGLAWCHRPGEPPFPGAIRFLEQAHDAGVRVETVAVDNFIELLSALERAIRLPDEIREWLGTHRPPAPLERAPLPPPGTVGWPVLRTNALPVLAMPDSGRVLTAAGEVGLDRIGEALRAAHSRGLVAARRGGPLIAFGDDADLAAALGPLGITVTGEQVLFDIDDDDPDTALVGLLRDAVTLALGRTAGLRHVLRSRADHLIRVQEHDHPSLRGLAKACGGTLGGDVPGTGMRWAEAVAITLEARNGAWWLLAAPEIWVSPRPTGTPPDDPLQAAAWRSDQQRAAKEFVRERLALRYNRSTAAILDEWIRLLLGRGDRRTVHSWALGEGAGVNASFTLAATTAWSRPLSGMPHCPAGNP